LQAQAPSAEVIDLGNATLLPGLIDCHTHLGSRADKYDELNEFRDSPFTSAFAGVVNARKTLEAGFTTVRDVGSAPFLAVDLRNSIAEGFIPGPRIVASGPGISITGGHGDLNNYSPQTRVTMFPEERDFGIADGSFATIRSGEVTCDGQCTPQHHAVVSTTFTKKGQSLMLLNSGVAAMARTEVEKFGVEALSHALAGEFKKPFWVAFTAANEYYQAQPNLPQDVNSSDDTMKLSFALLRTNPTKFQGQILLNSIGTFVFDGRFAHRSIPLRPRGCQW